LFFSDASNPQSLNLYAYVQNNPLAFVDPNGLQVDPSATQGWLLALLKRIGHFFSGGGGGGNPPPSPDPGLGGHWTTRQPTSGHFIAVVLNPSGAGWQSHMGDAVDTPHSSGWATARKFTPLDRVAVAVGHGCPVKVGF
jgi:hypothetical protein